MKTLHYTIIAVLAIGISTGTAYAHDVVPDIDWKVNYDSVMAQYQALVQDFNKAKSDLTTMNNTVAQYEHRNTQLQESIQRYVDNAAKLSDIISVQNNQILTLETRVKYLESQKSTTDTSELTSKITTLESQVTELEAKIAELKEDKQNKNTKIDELRDKLKIKNKEIEKLEAKIDRKNTKLDNKRDKISDMKELMNPTPIPTPTIEPEPTQLVKINASNIQSLYDHWQNIISQPPFWIYNATQLLESGSNVFTLSGVSIGSVTNSTTFTTYVYDEEGDEPIYTSQTVSDDSGEFLVKVIIDPTWQDGLYYIFINLDNNITNIGAHGYNFNTEIQDGVFITDEFYVTCSVQNALGHNFWFDCSEDAPHIRVSAWNHVGYDQMITTHEWHDANGDRHVKAWYEHGQMYYYHIHHLNQTNGGTISTKGTSWYENGQRAGDWHDRPNLVYLPGDWSKTWYENGQKWFEMIVDDSGNHRYQEWDQDGNEVKNVCIEMIVTTFLDKWPTVPCK